MSNTFRIHPSIGFARVGNSEEYYIAPETMAGLPLEGDGKKVGGLPIKAGTENQTITSADIRDKDGALKRQAARFRIFHYDQNDAEMYPNGDGKEIAIGDTVNGKVIKDIFWCVHLANKKANNYDLENPNLGEFESIIDGYAEGQLPPLRNPQEGLDPKNSLRIKKLVIDPGPRAISGKNQCVDIDKKTVATYVAQEGGKVSIDALDNYPKSFPDDNFEDLFAPAGQIDTLGELITDEKGRLLVVAAYGRAVAWNQPDGKPYPLDQDVDNDGWFDDTGDGPVFATIVYEGGETDEVHGAWVVSTDPAYAPQTLNSVSLWDDIYDTWIRKLRLSQEIYTNQFNEGNGGSKGYEPYFPEQIQPFFKSAEMQMWNTNLGDGPQKAHRAVGNIKATDDPSRTIMGGLAYVRNPNNSPEFIMGAPMMPLSLGDSGKPFLAATLTQYFFLTQWNKGVFKKEAAPMGPGEKLDMASLINCLGGRFSPGIDMTFIVRQPDIYVQLWRQVGCGPFRIHAKKIDYKNVQSFQPVLTEGYVPLHTGVEGLEPGDTSKFMALPWHTDYNSCATHNTDPNPLDSTTLYWSWPAQRPVAVYAAKDVVNGELGEQRYSVRGKGTMTDLKQDQGKFQDRLDMVKRWQDIGIIIQATAIEGGDYPEDYFLEVESRLDEPEVTPWPFNATE